MRGPRRVSAAVRLLGLRIRIPPWARMSFVLWASCVVQFEISAKGPIPRPGESCGLRCVWVWSRNFIEEDESCWGCRSTKENIYLEIYLVHIASINSKYVLNSNLMLSIFENVLLTSENFVLEFWMWENIIKIILTFLKINNEYNFPANMGFQRNNLSVTDAVFRRTIKM